MPFAQLIELAFAVVAALGIAGAVAVWVLKVAGKTVADGLLEKFKSDLSREVESYKTKLKKSEFIFQKEFEAASEFIAMKRSFLPPKQYLEMDWADASEMIAQNFDKIESQIGSFISKHGAILGEKVLKSLSSAEAIASTNKFEGVAVEPSAEAVDAAGELWDELEGIEKSLREVVLSQSST